jgi:hypothetical protein
VETEQLIEEFCRILEELRRRNLGLEQQALVTAAASILAERNAYDRQQIARRR